MKQILICLLLTYISIGQLYSQTNDTLVGKIVQIPSPCIDYPCLPGIVYAIENDTSVFIISIGKIWQLADNPLHINNITFGLNDSVVIIGNIYYRKDINLEKYYEIEIDTSYLLTTLLDETPINGIRIYPNPTNGIIQIYSNCQNINEIELTDISGRRLYYNLNMIDNTSFTIEFSLDKGVHLLNLKLENGQVITKKILFL